MRRLQDRHAAPFRQAVLRIPPETDEEQARALLERAERVCLITTSLKSDVHLKTTVEVVG